MMNQILDISLRSASVFIFLLIGLRFLGKNHLSQLSIVDFVLVILLSNAVQNAMVGNDTSLAGGMIAAVTLLLLSFVISFVSYRSRSMGAFFEGTPTMLIHNGKLLHENLRREKISQDELLRAIREHGIERIEDVKIGLLEADGVISVVPEGSHVTRIHSVTRLRTLKTSKINK
jgi:uncharacterized membrane protein YcaP (DUF421 family)